jgi:hypothetical protein
LAQHRRPGALTLSPQALASRAQPCDRGDYRAEHTRDDDCRHVHDPPYEDARQQPTGSDAAEDCAGRRTQAGVIEQRIYAQRACRHRHAHAGYMQEQERHASSEYEAK